MTAKSLCPVCGKENLGKGVTCSIACRTEAMKSAPLKEFVCQIPSCGKTFQSRGTTSRYCPEQHYRTCGECSKEVKVSVRNALEETYVCKSCVQKKAAAKARKTLQEKYGVVNVSQLKAVQEKKRQTSLERYGTEHWIRSDEVRKKVKATLQERYGVDAPFQSPEILEKTRKTHKERHGVENPFQRDDIKAKIRQTMTDRYGAPFVLQIPEFRERLIAKQLDHSFEFGSSKRISKMNVEYGSLLEEVFGLKVGYEARFGEFYADIVLGDVYVDLNPTISHNSKISYLCAMEGCLDGCEKHRPVNEDYHLKRALAAHREGVKLVQLYDWNSREEKERLIRDALLDEGVSYEAIELTTKRIDAKKATLLAEDSKAENHHYGLYSEDELLAVATFGESRFDTSKEYEWIRYAVKKGVLIHGGSGRLFQAFLDEVKPKSVISYVDFDHTTSARTFLNSCGFQELAVAGPGKIWSKGTRKIYHNSLLRQGADRLLGTSYGSMTASGLNNEDIMLLEGWLPVHTAGNRVFVWGE